MSRPAGSQWAPLGLDSDPVPGDPAQIGEEERHLTAVAAQISAQVTMLRKLASSDVEVGAHADEMRKSAGELADQLDKVVGRYQKVASALHGWIPELEQAQRMSITALDQAEGPHQKMGQLMAHQPPGVSAPLDQPTSLYSSLNGSAPLSSGGSLTAQQKQDVADYHQAMQRAQDELDAAKRLLDQAVSLRDTQGGHYAGVIRRACDDAVKDSWWDGFKNWVGKYAWLIKDICLALEIIATVLAVLALIFTGIGLALLIAGAVLTAVALVGRTMLAASGNGSWFDVIVDVIALVSFGAGLGMGKMLGTTAKEMTATAEGLRTGAADRVFADAAEHAYELDSRGLSNFAQMALDSGEEQRAAYLANNALPVVEKEAGTTFMERLFGAGDQEVVNNMKTVAGLTAKYGDSPAIRALGARAGTLQALLRANFAAVNVDTITPIVAGGVKFEGPNGSAPVDWQIHALKEPFENYLAKPLEMEGGLSTATADKFVVAGGALMGMGMGMGL